MSIWIDAVGVGAGLCSMASFVPQIVKLAREKTAEGVSLRTFAISVCGFVLWTTYGLLLKSWPIAASNLICLALVTTIFMLTWKYGRKAKSG
ncbi:MAG: SemiSWEET family sugar transporter [Caulobacteraceae bacterium]